MTIADWFNTNVVPVVLPVLEKAVKEAVKEEIESVKGEIVDNIKDEIRESIDGFESRFADEIEPIHQALGRVEQGFALIPQSISVLPNEIIDGILSKLPHFPGF
jgi:hypothetical protein